MLCAVLYDYSILLCAQVAEHMPVHMSIPCEAQQKRVHLQCVVLYHGSTLAVLLCLLCCCTRCAVGAVFSELLML